MKITAILSPGRVAWLCCRRRGHNVRPFARVTAYARHTPGNSRARARITNTSAWKSPFSQNATRCHHISLTPPPQHELPVPWRLPSGPRRPLKTSHSTTQTCTTKTYTTASGTSTSRRTLTSLTDKHGTPRLPTFAWIWARTMPTAPSISLHPHMPASCRRKDPRICIRDG